VATLFLPQLSSTIETPHPIIIAYLKAAQTFRTLQSRSEIKSNYIEKWGQHCESS
jgi:hypothetical protein